MRREDVNKLTHLAIDQLRRVHHKKDFLPNILINQMHLREQNVYVKCLEVRNSIFVTFPYALMSSISVDITRKIKLVHFGGI